MTKFKHGVNIALAAIIVLQLVVVFCFAVQKQGYFIDEISSYVLANSYYNVKNYSLSSIVNKWTDGEFFSNLVKVSESHRFAYDSVFYNQRFDTHPPFYYLLLHTICSFFPESFSKWYGLAINIIFFVVCDIFLFLLSKKIFSNQCLALLPSLVWGFSAGAVSDVIFIRMYMLLTMLTMMFTYFHFVIWEKGQSTKTLISIFLVTLSGFMTQYYFLIYVFFLAAGYCLLKIFQKKWKPFLIYMATMFGALLTGYLIFPFSIDHIFKGDRGVSAISSASTNNRFLYRLKIFLTRFSTQQFGGYLKELFIITISVYLLVLIYKFVSKAKHAKQNTNNDSYMFMDKTKLNLKPILSIKNIFMILFTFAVTATFLVIAKISPFRDTRYIYYLYPLISLLAMFYIRKVFGLFIKNDKLIFIGIVILFTSLTIKTYNNGQIRYIYSNHDKKLTIARAYGDYDCIYITDRMWAPKANIFELSEFQNIYLLKAKKLNALPGILEDFPHEKGVVFFIDTILDQDEVMKSILTNKDFNKMKTLFTTDYAISYLVE